MSSKSRPHSTTNLDLFRDKFTSARRQTGHLQKEVADFLGIDPQVLSRKLHGAKQSSLTHIEIKKIIQIMAQWDAITTQAEAIELLTLMGLRAESFSPHEWEADPLNRLEVSSLLMSPPKPAPVPIVSSSSHTPLPTPSASIIGREQHVQLLLDRLQQPAIRLLTLKGTGGVGKTRLALEVARQALPCFADGVFFVSLASLRDTVLVPSTIVQALHLSGPLIAGSSYVTPDEDLLRAFLRGKSLLLVLDNVEQLPEIAPFIEDLLSTLATLKILVTSRTVLHLYGEHEFEVPTLEVYSPDALPDAYDISQSPAIRLFVERAQAVDATFQITLHNVATINAICARLDGLPLAIELAAVRTKVLPITKILQRLTNGTNQSLTFLRSTNRTALQRHQTLQETLDWSYELLDPPQQRLFRRLSIFIGGWTMESALAVGLHEDPVATLDDVLEHMETLMNHSLVKRMSQAEDLLEEEPEPRFHFLETIREYGLGHLEASEEYEEIQHLHAMYYFRLVEEYGPSLSGRTQLHVVSLLALEQDNMRATLAWATAHNEFEILGLMCGSLGKFWEARSQFREAHRWIDKALTLTQETSPAVRANLLMAASRLALWENAYEHSRELAEKALLLFESIGDLHGKTYAIFQIGDTWHMAGEYVQANQYLEACLPLQLSQEDWGGYAFTLSRLGAVAILQGNLSQAWTWLNEALPLMREHSEPALLDATLVYLGVLALAQGDFMQSQTYLREGLLLAQHISNRYMLASDLIAFGCLLGTIRNPSYAARVCSAAEALFESLNTALPTAYRPLYATYIGYIKEQVDEVAWQSWWEEGKALSPQAISELVLAASSTND
jgi:predicted ATPase